MYHLPRLIKRLVARKQHLRLALHRHRLRDTVLAKPGRRHAGRQFGRTRHVRGHIEPLLDGSSRVRRRGKDRAFPRFALEPDFDLRAGHGLLRCVVQRNNP